MRRICEDCFHSLHTEISGRDRLACLRSRTLPDGKILRPPRQGWEAAIERRPRSSLDWRAPGDKCGPEAKNFKERI